MFGLALFGGLALFAAAVVALSVWAGRSARRRGRNGALWGSAAFVLLMLPLFWDYVPTPLLHRKLCAEEAGVKVFVPFEKWVQENGSEVRGTPVGARAGVDAEGNPVIRVNARVELVTNTKSHAYLPVFLRTSLLLDTRTHTTLVQETSVFSGTQYGGRSDWFRIWMNQEECAPQEAFYLEMSRYSALAREQR